MDTLYFRNLYKALFCSDHKLQQSDSKGEKQLQPKKQNKDIEEAKPAGSLAAAEKKKVSCSSTKSIKSR